MSFESPLTVFLPKADEFQISNTFVFHIFLDDEELILKGSRINYFTYSLYVPFT